jgi:DNA-directed RNA polymerase subunit RPC12/RpoP
MAGNTQKIGVICARCNTPVALIAPEKVAEEFSVACPKCGHRGLYRIKDIKTLSAR